MNLVLTSLPDDLPAWRGTAAELADKTNTLLPALNLTSDATLNERLVRYYVTEKLLTPPDREGKEAIFGFRQVIELLVIRYLLNDQWPLAKIRDIVQSVDLESLQTLLPPDRPRTLAEEVVSRIRRGGRSASKKDDSYGPAPIMSALPPGAHIAESDPWQQLRQRTLGLATSTTLRRTTIRDDLKALGAPEGEVARRETITLALTPWCQVIVDLDELDRMPIDAPETLGSALTQLLRDERNKRGGKS